MRFLLTTASCAVLAAACSSNVSGPGRGKTVASTSIPGAGGSASGGSVSGGSVSGGSVSGGSGNVGNAFSCETASGAAPGPRRLWRLSPSEFSSTVGDFVQGRRAPGAPSAGLPGNLVNPLIPTQSLYSTDSGFQTVTKDEFGQAYGVTLEVANQLVQTLKVGSCWATDQSEACVKTLVQERGSILLRRPLSDEEATKYTKAFTDARTELDADTALSTALQTILLTPYFLFKPEIGGPAVAGVVTLTPHEVGTQLSYSITGSPPDQLLWDAAGRGELVTPGQISTQVVRLMGSPDAHGSRNFVTEYFQLRHLLDVQKQLEVDTRTSPCPYDRSRMVAQAEALVAEVYTTSSTNRFFEALFTTSAVVADCGSESIFGVSGAPPVTAAPTKFTAPAGQRAGFLTHPAWLGLKAAREDTKPMKRGEFIYEEVFCQNIPPVNLNAVPVLPETTELTMREKFAMHTGVDCVGCHSILDPPGFAFENYDVVGAYRTTASSLNKPIDATGTLSMDPAFGDVAGLSFTNGVDFSVKLGASTTVQECVMKNGFRYYMGRKEIAADSCSLSNAKAAYQPAGSYVDFVASLAGSDSFLKRSF